ncbi:MAG: thiol-disulfide oxidoreductase DCC family protein [Sphingobacteriales bacterium]|nr:thiol-disulfide oxidoreductase DCC family protein [Sphingobacteriales bacterium]
MQYENPVILFDGICNYCNRIVNFIIRRDKKKIFRFAALQSEAGQRILKQLNLPTDKFESFILLDKEKVYQKSSAALRLYNKLPWYWKWTQLFWIFPTYIRDWVYGIIARNRYRWFGKRESCMVPTPELGERFLA